MSAAILIPPNDVGLSRRTVTPRTASVAIVGETAFDLPRAMSASGARYTDERELVWWEHQGKVRVEVRAADGDWTTRYEGLVPVAKSR